MRAFQWPWQARANKRNQIQAASTPFYTMWDTVARFAAEIRAGDFMAQMTRWLRPAMIVESGGFIGMSSAFILKALADEKLTTARLYSIEWSENCEQGALIPDELRSTSGGFLPLRGKVEDFLRRDQLPSSIDMFLHDSSHSYRHMFWEFQEFWPRLRDGALLVSHDVQMNAAFPEFVAKTYAHDGKTGRRDAQRTSHYEWGRWGYIGFVIKKS